MSLRWSGRRWCGWMVSGLAGLLIGYGALQLVGRADEAKAHAPVAAPGGTPSASPADGPLTEVQLAARIDELIAARWVEAKVEPAPVADDAEFVRRIYLDLAGKIPSVWETRAFLADTSADKRQNVVSELLESPAYIGNFTNVFRALMLPEADADVQVRFQSLSFEAWLRDKLTENAHYDDIVRELVTYPVNGNDRIGPTAFYRAKDLKPENLAAGTSRLFLGIRLECAQCHNHPFAKWQREEFWSLAAFYAGIGGDRNGAITNVFDVRELKIPDTEKTVPARFLDGTAPKFKPNADPRITLSDWLTSRENPYFARAAVNRLWAHLMGVGLVRPVDDFDEANPPSHPELLDLLAAQFALHEFDVKYMMRAIAASKTYQLTSRQTAPGQENPRLFARMAVKRMTPDQLFDSLAQATGFYEGTDFNNRFVVFGDQQPRAAFREIFTSQNTEATDVPATILQALALMNGQFVANATHPENSFTLDAVIESPFLDDTERIRTLYLASLNRFPGDEELQQMRAYVEEQANAPQKSLGVSVQESPTAATDGPGAAPKPDQAAGAPWSTKTPRLSNAPPRNAKQRALGDVFWALLNSNEFLLNH